MKMILGVLVVVILVILGVAMCNDGNSQTVGSFSSSQSNSTCINNKCTSQSKNLTCVQDSFGNYTCTNGDRILKDSNGNITVIPGRK